MFDALFTDPDVDQIFTDEAIIGAMLRFEGALVQAQADLNLIPSQPADLIAHVCLNAQIDADKIVASARDAGNPADAARAPRYAARSHAPAPAV